MAKWTNKRMDTKFYRIIKTGFNITNCKLAQQEQNNTTRWMN